MPCIGGPRRLRRRIRASGTTWHAASAVSAGSPKRRRPAIGPSPSTRRSTRLTCCGRSYGSSPAEANHIDELEARLARPDADYRARVFLGYALAKELDDVGRFDEAFHWFAAAAQARRARLAYDVATDERKLSRIAEAYPRETAREVAACPSVRKRP